MSDTSRAPRVLVELRPCFQGHAGIPQETRLIFAMLAAQGDIRPCGLVNTLAGFAVPSAGKTLSIEANSRLLIAIDRASQGIRARNITAKLRRRMIKSNSALLRRLAGHHREPAALVDLDPAFFGDFIWTRLFAMTLAPERRAQVMASDFSALGTSWNEADRFCGRPQETQAIVSEDFDFFLAQTPSPFRMSARTQTIVRYHDAIPIFWPHTISDTTAHNRTHDRGLKASLREKAVFVCTSEPVARDLLVLAPEAEASIEVIPDLVSPAFRPDPQPLQTVAEIMVARRHGVDEPTPSAVRQEIEQLLASGGAGNFVMAVSTIEPRKNFDLLLRAWQLAAGGPGSRLVIVGRPGWRCDDDLRQIRTQVSLGRVVHLAGVPLEELRILYTAAKAVVCPSRAEGFDLSGIEAMACGSAVLASDIPVHRWVYGEAAGYFDAYDPNALSLLLKAALAGENVIQCLRARGPAQAGLYGEAALAPRWQSLFERRRRQR
ncbi:hypothetical protein SAMN07250955_11842 [Arboricoccus pini]|uniref:Glycosyl transferase family 1 domain-containing protein n=1 Tax=Arboricoccus pini TaxID=1963835 RepID=A0A212S037_9PROT|nr:glycosyltransferase family 1 protein [Arboricoccus pini]SNB78325.1 hypothetical protein SAMN07250955_11842 [Arboricoccus pini]